MAIRFFLTFCALAGISSLLWPAEKHRDTPLLVYYFCPSHLWEEVDGSGQAGYKARTKWFLDQKEKIQSEGGEMLVLAGSGLNIGEFGWLSNLESIRKLGLDLYVPDIDELNQLDRIYGQSKLGDLPILGWKEKFQGDFFSERIVKKDLSLLVSDTTKWGAGLFSAVFVVSTGYDKEDSDRIPVFILDRSVPDQDLEYSQKNVYHLGCPSQPYEIGQLSLLFRDGNLIRQRQSRIRWNRDSSDRSWIIVNPDE